MPAARRIGRTSLALTIDDTEVKVRPHPPSYPWLCRSVRAASPARRSNAVSPEVALFMIRLRRPLMARSDRTQLPCDGRVLTIGPATVHNDAATRALADPLAR